MSCIVKGCCNTKRYAPWLTFFSLPKNRQSAQEWLRILGRLDLTDSEDRIYKVCSEHFRESDYTKLYPRKLLSHEAVPSLNLHHSQSDYANIIDRSDEEMLLRTRRPEPERDVEKITATDSAKTYFRTSRNTLKSTDVPSNAKAIRPDLNKHEMKRKKIDLQRANNRASIDISFINMDERLKQTHKNGVDYYERYCKAKNTIMRLRSKLKAQNRAKAKFNVENVDAEKLLAQCRSLLSERVFSLFENELYVALNNGRHRHAFGKTMRRFCLELYNESPKAYGILSNTLSLPRKSTIIQWRSRSLKKESGIGRDRVERKIEYERTDEHYEKYYEEVQYLDEDMLGEDALEMEDDNDCDRRS